jgi:hypothetical protein
MNASRSQLRQRADYTHKHNLKTGRHGWLRLTPAYSVKVVEELIGQVDEPLRIFDPFCGTATTALSAAYHGHEGTTTDINPFLVWLGKAKTAKYSSLQVSGALEMGRKAAKLAFGGVAPFPIPPLHNIERWWSPTSLDFLRGLLGGIDAVSKPQSPERTLLLVAFCRSLITLSNAAFNHQSMSFKDHDHLPVLSPDQLAGAFLTDVDFVKEGALDNPEGKAHIILGDSRSPASVVSGPFDMVITSPPYVNRMSYIRELRPYMYWLGYLVNGRDAGELDWAAIGGTWGVATSRLLSWQREEDGYSDGTLLELLDQVAHEDNKNGPLLANYIAKYFDDMWSHFRQLTPTLAPGAELHYIVGNSTFYGVLFPAEQMYASMLQRVGFVDVECRPIRKRNSKKELVEFDVVASWPGAESKARRRRAMLSGVNRGRTLDLFSTVE